MEIELLKELVDRNMSTHQIAKETGKSQTTIAYWIRKYGIRTKFTKENIEGKRCSRCKNIFDKSNFYTKGKGLQPYCKKCNNMIFSQRWIDRKIWAITYKGLKCVDCSLSYPDKPYVIFDFHHIDPEKKDMDWSKIKLTSKDRMMEELDKCVLLCSNCHRTRHHEIKKEQDDSYSL